MANFSKPLLESLKAPGSRKPLIIILATVLLLRSRLLSLPKKALSKLPKVSGGQKLSQQELADALQQVYVTEEDEQDDIGSVPGSYFKGERSSFVDAHVD